jgi:uncharacterized protein YfaS (alpha-2-macroglobulin family)
LLAAAAIDKSTGATGVTIDGKPLAGSIYRRYDQEHFDSATVTVANPTNQPTEAKISVTGIPVTPPPAASHGFAISRDLYLPDGTRVDLGTAKIHQNDRFVVVLTAKATALGSGQFVIADPLPAGFEIENPDLSANGDTSDYAWLKVQTPDHVESRTDQYVAAFRYTSDASAPAVSTAFMVRATAPGSFVMPGATVEDMYRPEQRGNADAAMIAVGPPAP